VHLDVAILDVRPGEQEHLVHPAPWPVIVSRPM
jgi:hypothetical protein